MKKFKKIFVAALVALALVAMPLCSMAAETDDYTTEGEVYNERTNGENQTDEGYTSETDEGYTGKTDEGYTGETDKTDDESPQDSATEKNSFEEVYSLLMSHISEILSLAAFVGSLVIAVLYKSGLMPLVEKGLSAISKTAQKIKEVTELGEGKRQEDYAALKGSVTSLEEKLTNMKNAISEYSDRLEAKESAEKREHRMEALTEGVLDLLYEIFMTSALPEYEKARVGEKVAKMKEVISTYEDE